MMNWGLAKDLRLKTELLVKPIEAKALNGEELFSITHISELIQLCINNHRGHICLHSSRLFIL